MRTIRGLATAGLVAGVFAAFAALWGWCNRTERTMGTADLGNGCRVRIWTDEDPSGPSQRFPTAYYSVHHGGTQTVAKSSCGHVFREGFGVQTAFADDGRLVCVYGVIGRWPEIAILFDHRTGEAWPHGGLALVAWKERIQKLVNENQGEPRLREIAAWCD